MSNFNLNIPTDRCFAFVCGLHRSGTTLVQRILSDNPEASGFANTGVNMDEGQFLQTVFLPAKAYGGVGLFGFNPKSYLNEHSEIATAENARIIFNEWSEHWDLSAKVYLEKSPPTITKTRFFQAMFPSTKFILIQRHPIAVSYATKKWSKTSIESLVEHWLVCHDIFEKDRPDLKNIKVIKYEDFIRQPQTLLNEMTEFLSLPQMKLSHDIKPTINDKYFNDWQRDKAGLLSRFMIKRIINKFEDRVRGYGYSLEDLNYLM